MFIDARQKKDKTICNLFVEHKQREKLPTNTMRVETKTVTEFTFCSTWIRSPPLELCLCAYQMLLLFHVLIYSRPLANIRLRFRVASKSRSNIRNKNKSVNI